MSKTRTSTRAKSEHTTMSDVATLPSPPIRWWVVLSPLAAKGGRGGGGTGTDSFPPRDLLFWARPFMRSRLLLPLLTSNYNLPRWRFDPLPSSSSLSLSLSFCYSRLGMSALPPETLRAVGWWGEEGGGHARGWSEKKIEWSLHIRTIHTSSPPPPPSPPPPLPPDGKQKWDQGNGHIRRRGWTYTRERGGGRGEIGTNGRKRKTRKCALPPPLPHITARMSMRGKIWLSV